MYKETTKRIEELVSVSVSNEGLISVKFKFEHSHDVMLNVDMSGAEWLINQLDKAIDAAEVMMKEEADETAT